MVLAVFPPVLSLSSNHPRASIIQNHASNSSFPKEMGGDSGRLYEMVTRHFIATLSYDARCVCFLSAPVPCAAPSSS